MNNIKVNLKDLIKDAHLWEYKDIGDTENDTREKKPKLFFTKIQWFFVVVSILSISITAKGFSADFAGYIISGLSLFVGVLFSFILTLFDKFKNIDFSIYKKEISEDKHIVGVKLKRFFKKTTILTLYSAILSIICILLLATILLIPEINEKISYCEIIENFNEVSICTLIKTFGITIFRCSLMYFLLNFILITVYIISSFYDYMISEINKIKL